MLLNPNNRSLYTDAFTPPNDMVFDQAIGAGFSMDPEILLTIPVHLSMLIGDQSNQVKDELTLLSSVRRLSKKITFYSQVGRMQVPRKQRELYGLLEKMIIEVKAPLNGVFHPKFWLLRFRDPSNTKSIVIRLIVLSRNLTKDRSWDVVLTLEGQPTNRNKRVNGVFHDMLIRLPDLAVHKTKLTSKKKQLINLADEMRRVEWELPKGFDEVKFYALGLKNNSWIRKLENSKKLAVISPFCSEGALDCLANTAKNPFLLVSRPETYSELSADTINKFTHKKILKEKVEVDDGEDTSDIDNWDTQGLHAKIYILERVRNSTSVIVGSANATDAALKTSKNVELLVELIGKTSKVGNLEEMLGRNGLGDVLEDLESTGENEPKDEKVMEAENALNIARNEIINSKLKISCSEIKSTKLWKLDIVGKMKTLQGISSIKAWLITTPENKKVSIIDLIKNKSANLGKFSISEVAGLLAIEIKAGDLQIKFALNVPISGICEETRDSAILQNLVGEKDKFFRYLQILLDNHDHIPQTLVDKKSTKGRGKGSGYSSGESPDTYLLEKLIRTYCREPDALNDVSNLVHNLKGNKEHKEIFPKQFLKTWEIFEEAMRERNGK